MVTVHSNRLFIKVLPDSEKVDHILNKIFTADKLCQNKADGLCYNAKKAPENRDAEKRENMMETIYEKKPAETGRRQLPNNRRQIGQPQQAQPEVFIEDYAFSFAKGLSEKDYTGCVVGVLVGEHVQSEQGEKILVRGVLEARDVLVHDVVCFTEDNWAGIYRDIREYFPREQIVGWFLGGPGFLLEDEERQKRIQADNFGGGDKILLKMDSIEKEQKVMFYQDGMMKELPGYYIFYERNAEMQNYMAGTNQSIPREEPVKYKRREERLPVKKEEAVSGEERIMMREAGRLPIPKASSFYQLFYATSGVLTCVAILMIAGLAMQIQERNQLKELLNTQEKLTSSMQQVYIVEEGETVDSICIKFYGTTEQAEAIRLLNSLKEEEEPEEGQKLFLP